MSGLIIPGEGFGKSVHGIDDRVIGARLLGWMVRECGTANWWISGLTKDGKILAWDSTGLGTLQIPKDRQHFAVRVMSALAREASEGGLWLTAWIDDGKRFYLLWKDEDGDIQIPIEIDVAWLRLREWPMQEFIDQAAGAFKLWEEFHANMDYSRSQKIMLAKGDRPADPAVL